jgi:hypothetical protein
VHEDLGRPDSALAHHYGALSSTRAVSDRTGQATTLRNIAAVYQRDRALDPVSTNWCPRSSSIRLRPALHLIEDHRGPGRLGKDQLLQPFRARLQLSMCVGAEEVDDQSLRKGRTEPGRLAGSARSQQEKAG